MIVTDKPKTTTSVVVVVVFVFVVVLVAAIVSQRRRCDGIVSMRREIGKEKETNTKNIYNYVKYNSMHKKRDKNYFPTA